MDFCLSRWSLTRTEQNAQGPVIQQDTTAITSWQMTAWFKLCTKREWECLNSKLNVWQETGPAQTCLIRIITASSLPGIFYPFFPLWLRFLAEWFSCGHRNFVGTCLNWICKPERCQSNLNDWLIDLISLLLLPLYMISSPFDDQNVAFNVICYIDWY